MCIVYTAYIFRDNNILILNAVYTRYSKTIILVNYYSIFVKLPPQYLIILRFSILVLLYAIIYDKKKSCSFYFTRNNMRQTLRITIYTQ